MLRLIRFPEAILFFSLGRVDFWELKGSLYSVRYYMTCELFWKWSRYMLTSGWLMAL
jgi:hypothetical protein